MAFRVKGTGVKLLQVSGKFTVILAFTGGGGHCEPKGVPVPFHITKAPFTAFGVPLNPAPNCELFTTTDHNPLPFLARPPLLPEKLPPVFSSCVAAGTVAVSPGYTGVLDVR
jgi:hypothetical protein